MTSRLLLPATCMPCDSVFAASGMVQTGITGNATATILIAIAATLLLMLMFRSSIQKLYRLVGTAMDKRRVRAKLRRHSKQLLHDFLLPGAYGGLTRIDHAVLLHDGLVCIQTKYCAGKVEGGADEPQWINSNGARHRKFLNPLIQNQGRGRALQNVLPGIPLVPVVVFCGDVELLSSPAGNVLKLCDLDDYLTALEFNAGPLENRDAAWAALTAAALTDKDSRKDFDAQLSFS